MGELTPAAYKNKDLILDLDNDIGLITIAKLDGLTVTGNYKFLYASSTYKLSKAAPGAISENLFLNYEKINVGDDCTIIGYPSSLQINNSGDYDFQRPLLRKGAIAGKDKNKGTIIVDCPSYKGNSGGPVFSTSIYDKSNIGLIGVVSRSILHVEELESSYYKSIVSVNLSNSGYTVIVPVEFARKLMQYRRSIR